MGTVGLSQDRPVVHRPKERINGLVTFSGATAGGYLDDKSPLLAKYSRPFGMVMDVKRNRFLVTDADNHVIRSIDTQGVTTFVGSKKHPGFQNGKQANAFLNNPFGIAHFLQRDVFFVADFNNNRIRMITPDGDVSVYAGTGEAVCRDGTTATASFCGPLGIAIDQRNGTVYVASNLGHCIQQITPKGHVITCAGRSGMSGDENGKKGHSKLSFPSGICFSEQLDSLFIADCVNHKIKQLDMKSGELSTVAGRTSGFLDGGGETAMFNYPTGIALAEDGSLLVADHGNNRIRRIKKGEKYIVETLVGGGPSGHVGADLLTSKLSSPHNVYVDNGTCYVAEQGIFAIRKFSL